MANFNVVHKPMRALLPCFVAIFMAGCNPEGWPGQTDLTQDEAVEVLREARKYEGTPYLLGGQSNSGMDCSGLLVEAMFAVTGQQFVNQNGELARDINADELARYNGRPVENPRKGDWVVFDVDWDGTYEHIGIFDSYQYDGNGTQTIMVFDASEAGTPYVEFRLIEDLDDKYHYFVRPQRVI